MFFTDGPPCCLYCAQGRTLCTQTHRRHSFSQYSAVQQLVAGKKRRTLQESRHVCIKNTLQMFYEGRNALNTFCLITRNLHKFVGMRRNIDSGCKKQPKSQYQVFQPKIKPTVQLSSFNRKTTIQKSTPGFTISSN